MKVVIQRVTEASVTVAGEVKAEIGKGMMILLGVEVGDTDEDLKYIVKKILGLRIFADEKGDMNLDIAAIDGDILLVSQFTLLASTRKGNRPSFIHAEHPIKSEPMYEKMVIELSQGLGKSVQRGIFGADMQVRLVNDGPVTIVIDSRNK